MTDAAVRNGWLSRQVVPVVITVALAMIALFTRDEYVLGVWTFVVLNVIVVVGLDLLLGYAGQLSLGHGAFVGIGAYTSALLTAKLGWNGWLAIPLAMLIAASVATLVAIPTLRLRGYYLAMATLGFPILFEAVLRVGSSWSGGSSGVTTIPRLSLGGRPLSDPVEFYLLVVAAAGLVILLCWNIAQSRLGLKLLAIHADEVAAMARGINVVKYKVATFALSAAIASLSGSLYVHGIQFVAPTTFGLQYSLMLVVMLVAGGMGRIWGGVLGVVLLGWLPELMRDAVTWQPMIFGSLLALIMLFSPKGLAGLVRRRSSFKPVQGPELSAPLPEALQTTPALLVQNVSKRFGGVQAVSGLNFEVAPGEVRSIVGPNGAGKSTALALISGVFESDEGTVSLGQRDVTRLAAHLRARAGLARTFQHARLIEGLTVCENIVLGANVHPCTRTQAETRATHVLSELGLTESAQRFPAQINHFERRLTEVATALAASPSILLLDEPGAGLSEVELRRLSDTLREQRARGTAIVLVDHIMSLVLPLSDRLLVLDGGRQIADGHPDQVMADERVRAAYLGQGGAHA